jgi:hypothetical protein
MEEIVDGMPQGPSHVLLHQLDQFLVVVGFQDVAEELESAGDGAILQ